MRKILGSMMIAGLLFTGVACGGDDGDSGSDTETTEASSGDNGGESSGNAEVDEYCQQAEELAEELKKVMADPTSGDVAALTTQANDLVAAAAALVTASPDDVDRINECSAKITEGLGG